MADELCLLQIHAHPDDEASKGAGTSAKYAAEGVRNVLVCCTGGEEGDILNPAMERPEVRADLAGVRMAELAASARAIGYASVEMLGYRDSGMPDTEANARPDNFANAPLAEAVERFVKIIRAERPQVIITYHEDRNWYPHPDHLRVWEISGPAFDAAGDPDQFPDAGEPWQPSKLYYVAWSMARVKALHAVYIERGEESPFARWFEGDNPMPDRDERFTTRIDVSEHLGARRAALLAHATQVDPEGHWMAIPDELVRSVYPWEDYILARTLVEGTVPEDGYEEDLFAGLREPAGAEQVSVQARELDVQRRAESSEHATMIVDFVVAERKKELERVRVGVDGDSVTPRAVDDTAAEVVFTLTPADAAAVRSGDLNLSVAFMRGTMKMAGDSGALFHALPVLSRAQPL